MKISKTVFKYLRLLQYNKIFFKNPYFYTALIKKNVNYVFKTLQMLVFTCVLLTALPSKLNKKNPLQIIIKISIRIQTALQKKALFKYNLDKIYLGA